MTGEGGSGGALALAASDRVLMLENSYYSVISPEGCATILFKDAAAAPRAAAALRITAPDLLRLEVMDAVVPEPAEGAHTDHNATAANVKTGARREPAASCCRSRPRSCSRGATTASASSALPAGSRYSRRSRGGGQMSDDKKMIESTWAEARDLVRQLEGTSVQRFAVKAGDYEIEIERGGVAQAAAGAAGGEPPSGRTSPRAPRPARAWRPGRAAPRARSPRSADEVPDNRVPVLAPLVGTFYRVGAARREAVRARRATSSRSGQTVCIVEAMKLMNEVGAGEGGKVAEILRRERRAGRVRAGAHVPRAGAE